MTREIIFVTSNKWKAAEVESIFRKHKLTLEIYYGETPEIQSENLRIISLFRALTAYLMLGKPLFVEDAGLFIEALKGFPGPYSSYVYKTIGLENILKIVPQKERRATFLSCICFINESGPRFFTGKCDGTIAMAPRGSKGFGYDPIFIPKGLQRTLAELEVDEKNQVSHRGVAVDKLCRWLYKDLQKRNPR